MSLTLHNYIKAEFVTSTTYTFIDLYRGNHKKWNSGNIPADKETCSDFIPEVDQNFLILYGTSILF